MKLCDLSMSFALKNSSTIPSFGLRHTTVIALEMRAQKHRFEFDPLRAEKIQDEAMGQVEGLARENSPSPARLDW